MNEKTAYELTIAGKLQQLPLPDMEDAIWARIQTQLDRELPEDNNGSNGPFKPSGGWMGGAGLLVFVAALLTVFILVQKKSIQPQPSSPQAQPNTEIFFAPPFNKSQPPNPPPGRRSPAPLVQPAGSSPVLPRQDAVDSVALVPLTVRPPEDMAPLDVAPLSSLPRQDSTGRPKTKTRGVRDITDADYRIVPTKRDST